MLSCSDQITAKTVQTVIVCIKAQSDLSSCILLEKVWTVLESCTMNKPEPVWTWKLCVPLLWTVLESCTWVQWTSQNPWGHRTLYLLLPTHMSSREVKVNRLGRSTRCVTKDFCMERRNGDASENTQKLSMKTLFRIMNISQNKWYHSTLTSSTFSLQKKTTI